LFFIYFLQIRRVGRRRYRSWGLKPSTRPVTSAPEITFVLVLPLVALNMPTVSRLPARNHQVANQLAVLL
jgi:hypothetical protein